MNLKPIGVAKDKQGGNSTLFIDTDDHDKVVLIARMSKRKDIVVLESEMLQKFRPTVRTQYNVVLTDANIGLLPHKPWDMAFFVNDGMAYLRIDSSNIKNSSLTYVSKKTGAIWYAKVSDICKKTYRRTRDEEYDLIANHMQEYHSMFSIEVATTISELETATRYANNPNILPEPRIGAYGLI